MTETKWLTPKEVATELRVDRATVQRWIRDGKLPALSTPGGQYRILRSEVDALQVPIPDAS